MGAMESTGPVNPDVGPEDPAVTWARERSEERRLCGDLEEARTVLRRVSGFRAVAAAVVSLSAALLVGGGVAWLSGARFSQRFEQAGLVVFVLMVVSAAAWVSLSWEIGPVRSRVARVREELRFLRDVRAYREAGGEPASSQEGSW